MSTSLNESFVVVSTELQDVEGRPVTPILKPLVTFENVLDVYPLELDLLVKITFNESYRQMPDEQILLVPVAFKNVEEDLVSFGDLCNNIVKFPMEKLPQNEMLCQFCYYESKDKSILSVSKPFKLQHYTAEQLIQFINDQDHAVLLNALQHEILENDNPQLIQRATDEVIKNLIKKWTTKKESLQNEIKELKESVKKFQKMAVSSSDTESSDSECTLNTRTRDISVIYGITPTYARLEQKAILTRLTHTLRLVPCFHWIVVEDAESRSHLVSDVLSKSGLSFTHLAAMSPKSEKPDCEFVVQRNAAIRWLRHNKRSTGIVYFLDDYKIYSLEIFEEMRSIEKVGVWPVGLAGGLLAEKPIVNSQTGRVVGWNSRWRPDRRFPIDATGCAINLQHLIAHPNAELSLEVEPALRLSAFLSKLVSVDELEPKASNCSEVYVWHIRIQPPHVG